MEAPNSLFLTAFGIGIAFTALPGAVNLEAARRGLHRGFGAAFRFELGSLVGDAFWAILALAGAAVVVQHRPIQIALGVAGTVLLLILARQAWRGSAAASGDAAATPDRRGDFLAGALIALANPAAIAFWLGVGGAIVAMGSIQPGPTDFAIFLAGFLTAAVLWCVGYSTLVAFGRRIVGPKFFRWIDRICALVLLYFAVRLLIGTIALTGSPAEAILWHDTCARVVSQVYRS